MTLIEAINKIGGECSVRSAKTNTELLRYENENSLAGHKTDIRDKAVLDVKFDPIRSIINVYI